MSDIPTPYDMQATTDFDQATLEHWQNLAEKSLRGKTLAQLAHTTASGLSFEALYTSRPDATQMLSAAPMQRWDNRLALVGKNADVQNACAHAGLQGGVDSLHITLDCPEQPAHIGAEQLSRVLANVQLDIISVGLCAGSQFTRAAEQLAELWKVHGISSDKALASFNADPIGTMAITGGLTVALNTLLQEMTDFALGNHQTFPKVTSVCVNGVCYHNAGATMEQELVSIVATAATYLQALLDAGMDEQAATGTLVFQVACDADTLANVVKLRALKQLWVHVAMQMGVAEPHFKLVVETSQRMQSVKSPWVNHLRNVSAATAAAMGGANSIIVHPHNRIDNQYIDDQETLAARVARNIPIILRDESAMDFVHDPMAGSYAVESVTANLVDATWDSLQKLENDGGLASALTSGRWQSEISVAQMARVARMQNDEDIQVGVNRFEGSLREQTQAAMAEKESGESPASQNAKRHIEVTPLTIARDAVAFES